MNNDAIPKKEYSLQSAYGKLPREKQKEFRERLMQGFSIKRIMFYRMLKGMRNLSEVEIQFVRTLFLEYGISNPFEYERSDFTPDK